MQVQTVWKAGSERHDWRVFLLQTCLTLAVLLLGGALICWVAANWAGWSRFERLAGAQGALAVVTLPAIYLLWRTRSQAARSRSVTSGLIGLGCVALGGLLALIGQTYQTGADTWQLFALWAALMLPWAIAGRSASVWLLWIAVVNTALALARGPLSVPPEFALLHHGSAWMTAFNLAALACWTACATGELALRRTGPRVLAALALATATVAVFDDPDLNQAGMLLWLWTAVPLTVIYRRARPDGAVLAMIVLSTLAVAMNLVWTPLVEAEWAFRLVLTIVISLAGGVLGHLWIGQALRRAGVQPDSGPYQVRPLAFALASAAAATALIALAVRLLPPEAAVSNALMALYVAGLVLLGVWGVVVRRTLARTRSTTPVHKGPAAGHEPVAAQDVADSVGVQEILPARASGHPPGIQAAGLAQAILLAATAWFSAALFLGLLLLLSFDNAELVVTTAGPVLALIGVGLTRLKAKSLFLMQVASALAFAGLLLVVADLFAFTELGWLSVLRLIGISLVVYVLSGYATMQFLAALVLALGLVMASWLLQANPVDIGQALGALFDGPGVHALGAWTPGSFGLAALAIVLFLADGHRRAKAVRRFDALPMAWGMALAALAAAWVSAGVPVTQFVNLWALHAPTALILAAGALLPALASMGAMWPLRSLLTARMRWGVPLGLLALGILWLPSPGILFALSWTLLGFGLRRRGLLALGSVSLIGYLCAYYYQLGVPLLDKALWLGLAGLVAAALALALLRAHARAGSPSAGVAAAERHTVAPGRSALTPERAAVAPERSAVTPERAAVTTTRHTGWRAGLALVGLVLALGLANTTIWQREQLIAHGQEVLLALAPVDPRSLMQGDYMRLEFVLARDIAQRIEAEPGQAPAGDAYAILSLSPDNQAQLLRLQPTLDALAPQEIALHYRNDGEIRIVTNAWFFAEGQAEHFAKSRFGVLRVDNAGRALLIEMRDAELKPL